MNLTEALARYVVEDGDCLRWTGCCVNGHPYSKIDGKSILVRRALWLRDRGPIPAGRILRCTCGLEQCISLDHARLTTYKAVAIECGAMGLMSGPVRSARIAAVKRAGPQSKLTDADVAAIRASNEPISVLGPRYGITPSHASRVRNQQHRRDFVTPWQGLMP